MKRWRDYNRVRISEMWAISRKHGVYFSDEEAEDTADSGLKRSEEWRGRPDSGELVGEN